MSGSGPALCRLGNYRKRLFLAMISSMRLLEKTNVCKQALGGLTWEVPQRNLIPRMCKNRNSFTRSISDTVPGMIEEGPESLTICEPFFSSSIRLHDPWIPGYDHILQPLSRDAAFFLLAKIVRSVCQTLLFRIFSVSALCWRRRILLFIILSRPSYCCIP